MPGRIDRLIIPFLLSCLLFVACEESPVETYTSGLMSSKTKAAAAADAATLSAVEATINNYRAIHGKNPSDLGEISAMMGIELDPGKYIYDPVSGKIQLKSGP